MTERKKRVDYDTNTWPQQSPVTCSTTTNHPPTHPYVELTRCRLQQAAPWSRS